MTADVESTRSEAQTPDLTTSEPADSEQSGGSDDNAGSTDGEPGAGSATPSSVGFDPPDASGLPSIGDVDDGTIVGSLDNGLRYFVRENQSPGGSAELRLAIDAGSSLEGDDQLGGAHFLEHMLFNGTEKFPENELIAVLRSFGAAFGADINAYTSYDETVYQLTVPTDDGDVVDTALDVLADWLSAATIDTDQVDAERGVVLDEWRQDSGVDGRVFDGIEALFLADSPYAGRRPIGTRESIEGLTSDQLRRYYDDWYRPDLATVVVVGDIDAVEIEQGIIERFEVTTARGDSPERPELIVEPTKEPRAEVVVDDDVVRPTVFVTLPAAPGSIASPSNAPTVEAIRQRAILEDLAFDIIATRLEADALDGVAPFDSARVDSSGFVRGLTAPEIVLETAPAAVSASIEAVLVEYARVARDGFTDREVSLAVERYRALVDTNFAARDSKQDAAYAEEYVRLVLEDVPSPSAVADRNLSNEILDRADPSSVAWSFATRYENTGVHMFVASAEPDGVDVPRSPELVELAFEVAASDVSARTERTASDSVLIAPAETVEEAGRELVSEGQLNSFVRPLLLTFPNGARVTLNQTPITDGVIVFEARSPGGYALVADEDVPDAQALGEVAAESGIGDLNRADLDALISGSDLSFSLFMSWFTEGMFGFTSTADVETLFTLVHNQVVAPRFDEGAIDRFVREQLPLAEDPGLDPGYANFVAVLDARYDDPRGRLLDADGLESVDVAGMERVFDERFGDVSDWVFAFSGDLDIDVMVELSRRYIGTLPGDGIDDNVDFVEEAPPAGVVQREVTAASGDLAVYSLLFSAIGTADRADDVLARGVSQVITSRLTDVIREELGQSYSPFGSVDIGSGAGPEVSTYISVTTGPELLEPVAVAITSELDRLRTDGPTEAEIDAVLATLGEQLDLFSNQQINDEILNVLTDPAGNGEIDDFLTQRRALDELTANRGLLAEKISEWLPADQFVEVRVLPR